MIRFESFAIFQDSFKLFLSVRERSYADVRDNVIVRQKRGERQEENVTNYGWQRQSCWIWHSNIAEAKIIS